MRPVAGRALAFLDRGMLERRVFTGHKRLRIPMAGKTYRRFLAFHQRRIIRRMGTVTIDAIGARTDMAVDLLKIVLCGFVTSNAQGSAGRFQPQGVAGIKALMARPAFFLRKGLVKGISYQAFTIRRVGTVAGHAVRTLNGVAQMGFLRFGVGNGMTGGAQRFSIFFDEPVMIRCVGAVATQALAFLQRGVGVFLCKAGLSGMATKAKLLPGFL